MRRRTALGLALLITTCVAVAPQRSHAIVDDTTLCPGTGVECVVKKKVVIADPAGIDLTHPLPVGSPPLTLHIVAGGEIDATSGLPLTIKAGDIIIDKGGAITGDAAGANANTLTILARGAFTVAGKIEAIATKQDDMGGDGGMIEVTAGGACAIEGKLVVTGTTSGTIGAAGGDISLECASIDLARGALLDASASGPGGEGGSINLIADTGGLELEKKSVLRAFGTGLDGGSVSLSTNPNDLVDPCDLNGKIQVDAKTVAMNGGSGGTLDVACGGDVNVGAGAYISMSGSDGGGSVDVFGGGSFNVAPGTAMRANGINSSGGSIDIVAGNDVQVCGKMETRSAGMFGNDGYISVTNGGDLVLTKGAVLNASAAGKNQQAGQITLAGGVDDGSGGGSPAFEVQKGAILKANGYTAGLGALDIDLSGGACDIAGTITSQAQDQNGITIGLSCDSVVVEQTAVIHADTKAGAGSLGGVNGGTLTIDTTGQDTGGTIGPCTINGTVTLKASSATFFDELTASTILIPGHGGTLSATCGTTMLFDDRANIAVSASGLQSVGGQVNLSADQPATIRGKIAATASGTMSAGGAIAAGAPNLTVDDSAGSLDVGGDTGGTIELSATGGTAGTGALSVGKPLSAKGKHFGGNIVLRGCDVTVGPTGQLRTDGSPIGGTNEVLAGGNLTIAGKMSAVNGENRIVHSTVSTPTLTGSINPSALLDTTLAPCL